MATRLIRDGKKKRKKGENPKIKDRKGNRYSIQHLSSIPCKIYEILGNPYFYQENLFRFIITLNNRQYIFDVPMRLNPLRENILRIAVMRYCRICKYSSSDNTIRRILKIWLKSSAWDKMIEEAESLKIIYETINS